MEQLKQYLPYIIIGVVILYVIRKFGSQQTTLVPQTQFSESQQIDPFIESRSKAFDVLGEIGIAEIGAGVERARNEIVRRAQELDFRLASKGLDIDLAKTRIVSDAFIQDRNLTALQREQDRQVQNRAIDRFYSSRSNTTGNIVSSIGQTLSSIFGNRGSGTIFGTPPTFPRF